MPVAKPAAAPTPLRAPATRETAPSQATAADVHAAAAALVPASDTLQATVALALQQHHQSVVDATAVLIAPLTASIARLEQELAELKAAQATAPAASMQASTASTTSHVSGVYSITAPATPMDLSDHHNALLRALKLAGATFWKAVPRDKHDAVLTQLAASVAPALDIAAHAFERVSLRRALLLASISAELFRGFEGPTYGMPATHVPTLDRTRRLTTAAAAWRAVMRATPAELLETSVPFSDWVADVAGRLQRVWTVAGVEAAALARLPQVLACAHLAWGLHALARAFPWQPELVWFGTGAAADLAKSTTHFNLVRVDACVAAPVTGAERRRRVRAGPEPTRGMHRVPGPAARRNVPARRRALLRCVALCTFLLFRSACGGMCAAGAHGSRRWTPRGALATRSCSSRASRSSARRTG